MHTPNAITRNTTIHNAIRRRMSDLARRAQLLHVDPRSVNAIRFALYN